MDALKRAHADRAARLQEAEAAAEAARKEAAQVPPSRHGCLMAVY